MLGRRPVLVLKYINKLNILINIKLLKNLNIY